MRWRRLVGVATVAVGLGLSTRTAMATRLEGIETRTTADGATASLRLTGPTSARSFGVDGADGEPVRVYVDLPVGTRLAAGLPRLAPGAGPLAAVRVGSGDDGSIRVAFDLVGASAFRVVTRGRSIVVEATGTRRSYATVTPGPPAPSAPAGPPPRRLPSTRARIVLDPGHGGKDPGAQGYAIEKHVTLDIAQQLRDRLRARLGADVVLTRDDDATLTLGERTARANSEGADLFVSIHANANPHGRLHGIETYVLDNTGDHATMRLATMENGLDMLKPAAGRTDLRYLLSSLVQGGKTEESAALARSVQRGLVHHLRPRYPDTVDLGVKRGPFYVLVGAYMPCVLVETAFLTHPTEGRRLARPAYREEIAEGLYQGIAAFLADSARARTL